MEFVRFSKRFFRTFKLQTLESRAIQKDLCKQRGSACSAALYALHFFENYFSNIFFERMLENPNRIALPLRH
jgi:hypothetical protein